ncbi:MAG: hydantoinase/oxoprolinase family protein [Hyphomicrobiaceae bacterium]
MRTKYRLGIDAGGTFTDFVIADETGQIRLYKALSTPSDPTKAIENGLKLMADALQTTPSEIVSNCDLCINGTTVGLNALIQHKGAKVGLIATAGHEDSIEIRLGHKEDGYRYDPEYPPAKMLVPRYLRKGVRERVISDGSIRTPMVEEDVRAACEVFRREGVEAVAISFVWSVINPTHERRAAEIVREILPNVNLTVGSELYPQVREYTRTSTAVTNAYLSPVLRRYVDAVDAYFRSLGARYPVRYFQSNGGLAIGQAMTDRSVYAINSGPASGPAAGLYVTSPFGAKNVITVDMGGTSFDITLVKDGTTNLNKNIDFLRYRIGVPMIQVETLGAGGGSIGWIDSMGLLQVGPQSAGALPGPACYGQGGTEPTVSDANLLLGYLNPDGLLGGKLPLDRGKATAAVKGVADPLGLSVERTAYGMYTIVNNNMVNGIRRVSVERGYDPRDFVLVCAGGATAAHIAAIAREMGIDTVVVPKLASGLCAFGQIISDVKYNYMATAPVRLDNDDAYQRVDSLFKQIEAEGRKHLEADGFEPGQIDIQRSLEMRYIGQVHECTVEIGNFPINASTIDQVKEAFHKRHEQLYTYSERHNAVEVVNIESTLYGRIEHPKAPRIAKGGNAQAAIKSERPVIFSADGTSTSTPIYDGAKLGAGDKLAGPAVIEEDTTTIVVEPDWQVELHESGSYIMTRSGGGAVRSIGGGAAVRNTSAAVGEPAQAGAAPAQARAMAAPRPAIAAMPVSASVTPIATTDGATATHPTSGAGAFAFSPGKSLISEGVSVQFEGLKALSEVSLEIPSGRITGLIGPNGAGKTTLVNVLTGFQAPDRGQVRIDGEAVAGNPAHMLRRLGIARTFQSGRLFRELPVVDNLEVTGVGLGLSRPEAIKEAERVLAWLGIAHLADTIAGALPYTDERRVAIGRAIMMKPRYVLLDEPAAGMSAEESRDLARIIRLIASEMGIGVLLIEHNIGLVLEVCERIFVLDSGEIVDVGTPEQIRTSDIVRHAYMGTQSDDVSGPQRNFRVVGGGAR